MNSQDLVIGDDDSDNDYTNDDLNDEDYNVISENGDDSVNENEMGQEEFDDLVNVLETNRSKGLSQASDVLEFPTSRLNRWLQSQSENVQSTSAVAKTPP